ncbi:MAG: hypothetical protein ACUVUC_01840 [Thermoguttaceae bacterium]
MNRSDQQQTSQSDGLEPGGLATAGQRGSAAGLTTGGPELAPSGFVRVARRIASWTSRLIVSTVILLAALLFGREAVRWWHTDPAAGPELSELVTAGSGLWHPTGTHLLQFGDRQWTISRQRAAGPPHDVAARLRAMCRADIQEARLPEDRPGPAEREFLQCLAGRKPVEQHRGRWQLYELEGAFPIVVGVKPGEGAGGGGSPSDKGAAHGTLAAEAPHSALRVVSWGLAVPNGDNAWTLYNFRASGGLFEGDGLQVRLGLPPGFSRILCMSLPGGGGMVSFRGPADLETCKQFFERMLAGQGCQAVGQWQELGGNWWSQWKGGNAPARGSIDVHLAPDPRGGLTGLVILAAGPAIPNESEAP